MVSTESITMVRWVFAKLLPTSHADLSDKCVVITSDKVRLTNLIVKVYMTFSNRKPHRPLCSKGS